MDAIIHLYSYFWHNRDLCLRTCLKRKSPEMEVLQRHTRQERVKCLRDRQVFKLVHVPTVDNLADLGTKILATEVFRRLRALIMFSPPDHSGAVVNA